MKRVLAVCAGWLLLLSGLLSGCTGEKGDSADSPLWGDMEEVEDSVPKATAIAWVDCDRNRSFSSYRQGEGLYSSFRQDLRAGICQETALARPVLFA